MDPEEWLEPSKTRVKRKRDPNELQSLFVAKIPKTYSLDQVINQDVTLNQIASELAESFKTNFMLLTTALANNEDEALRFQTNALLAGLDETTAAMMAEEEIKFWIQAMRAFFAPFLIEEESTTTNPLLTKPAKQMIKRLLENLDDYYTQFLIDYHAKRPPFVRSYIPK